MCSRAMAVQETGDRSQQAGVGWCAGLALAGGQRLRARSRLVWAVALLGAAALAGGPASRGAEPLFYPDDPILVDDDTLFDAGGIRERPGSAYYDFVENTFLTPGENRDVRAMNINTADEVPDSSWFTNRLGHRPLSLEELTRGPNRVDRLTVEGWPIVEGKGQGRTPGWRVADPDGQIYQIEFDEERFPERISGAEVIGTLFYHAIGYHVVETYLVEIDPARIVLAPDVTLEVEGAVRPFTRLDVEEVLDRAARLPNGNYRAIASRFADGDPLGPFRYYGTRPDDPNDIVAHEHRRELRGNRVFASWLNHVDSRGVNSLDMLVGPVGGRHVRHYLFDFGSIIGGGPGVASQPRAGNEYILDWGKGFKTLASLGLYRRPWLRVQYPDTPRSVGRFEAESFDPRAWRPEYPNPAFRNLMLDDAYWAARTVSRFSDAAIRAVVGEARYSDPRASAHVADTLIARRDAIARLWLNELNPIHDPRLDGQGRLTFDNAAVDAGVASEPTDYVLTWYRVDNATGEHTQVGEEIWITGPQGRMPAPLGADAYVAVLVRGIHPVRSGWLRAARVHFRRTAGGWETVGIERAFDERVPVTRRPDRE